MATPSTENNAAFAFVVNSLLRSNKNAKTLSKAKKLTEFPIVDPSAKPEAEIELVTESGKVVKPPKTPNETASTSKLVTKKKKSKLNKHDSDSIGRVKPNPATDRQLESILTGIATKGVVQLFNVVKEQKKTIKKDLEETTSSMSVSNKHKKAKILSKYNEDDLFDKVNSVSSKKNEVRLWILCDNEFYMLIFCMFQQKKQQSRSSDDKKWNVLKEDFNTGYKLKDWDKEEDDDSDESNWNQKQKLLFLSCYQELFCL